MGIPSDAGSPFGGLMSGVLSQFTSQSNENVGLPFKEAARQMFPNGDPLGFSQSFIEGVNASTAKFEADKNHGAAGVDPGVGVQPDATDALLKGSQYRPGGSARGSFLTGTSGLTSQTTAPGTHANSNGIYQLPDNGASRKQLGNMNEDDLTNHLRSRGW